MMMLVSHDANDLELVLIYFRVFIYERARAISSTDIRRSYRDPLRVQSSVVRGCVFFLFFLIAPFGKEIFLAKHIG